MPWIVDLWLICDSLRSSAPESVRSISGNVSTKEGKVKRPPITPLRWSDAVDAIDLD